MVLNVNRHWETDYTELLEAHHLLKTRYITLKEKYEEVKNENLRLTQQQDEFKIDKPDNDTKKESFYSIDDIEALKQQLSLYKEDFLHEKNDHIKTRKENTKIRNDIRQAKEIIDRLQRDSKTIRESYKKLYTEKENIIHELRRLTNPSLNMSTSPQHTPFSNGHYGSRPVINSYTLKPQRCSDQWLREYEFKERHSDNSKHLLDCPLYSDRLDTDGSKSPKSQVK